MAYYRNMQLTDYQILFMEDMNLIDVIQCILRVLNLVVMLQLFLMTRYFA